MGAREAASNIVTAIVELLQLEEHAHLFEKVESRVYAYELFEKGKHWMLGVRVLVTCDKENMGC